MKRIALCLLLAGPVWPAVTPLTDSGDPVANGASLQAAILNADCGDTIVLPAGATFRSPDIIEGRIVLPYKDTAACNAADPQWITIQSSRAAEIPEGKRVSPGGVERMARIDTNREWGPVEVKAKAHHYRFIGILFTTASTMNAANRVNQRMIYSPDDGTVGLDAYPHHIWVDRCVARPYEMELDPVPHFRTAIKFLHIEGREIWLTNSYVYGFSGWSAGAPERAVSSAVAGNPPEITGDAHGKSTGSTWPAWISGATGNWSRINGLVVATATNATSFTISKGVGQIADSGNTATVTMYQDRPHSLQAGDSFSISGVTQAGGIGLNGSFTVASVINSYTFTYVSNGVADGYYDSYSNNIVMRWDGSGAGPLTGTVRYRDYGLEVTILVLAIAAPGPYRVVNNHLESWYAQVFTGGGGMHHRGSATISNPQVGSATFSNVTDLRVGELIGLQISGGIGWAVGKVTGIDGTTVSWTTWGRNGITGAPLNGGAAKWGGTDGPYLDVRRNTFHKNPGDNIYGQCKGVFEFKLNYGGIWDGNQYTGFPCSLGVSARNQTGATPWATVKDLTFSNNLGIPAGSDMESQEDPDTTSTPGDNMRRINNLYTYTDLNWTRVQIGGAGPSTMYQHNTYMGASPGRAIVHAGCGPNETPPNQMFYGQFRDNIIGFGYHGVQTNWGNGECYPERASKIRNNVFLDDASVLGSQSALNSAVPGNLYASNPAAIRFEGVCTAATWQQCGLAANSPYKNAATDGKDIGADVAKVRDHINGWSEAAGLILTTGENNPAAFLVGSRQAAVQFRLMGGALESCSAELYVTGGRTALHADTASQKSCGRDGNVVEDGTVRFVFGTQAALTPSTAYYYKITDGERVMVGEFRTGASATQDTRVSVQVSDNDANNLVLEYAAAPDFETFLATEPVSFVSQRALAVFPVPSGSVRYYRWKKRTASNAVLGTGPTMVAVAQ